MNLRQFILSLSLSLAVLPGLAQDFSMESARNYLERASSEPNAEDAAFFYQKALELYRTLLPEQTYQEQDYWDASTCAVRMGDNDYLTSLLQLILHRTAEDNGVESEPYAFALQKAAGKCIEANDNKQAWRLLKRSDRIYKKTGRGPYNGRDMESFRYAMHYRANLCWRETRYNDALRYARRLIKEESRLDDNDHYYYQALLLASNIAAGGIKPRIANKYSLQAFTIARPMVAEAFNHMSEAARDRYWRNIREELKGADNPRFDYLLMSKGILLKASMDFNDLVTEKGDSLAKDLLAALNAATIKGAPADTLEVMDRRLVQHMEELGILYQTNPSIVNQKQIQKAISRDDLVIEFYLTPNGEPGAALLKKDWKNPEYVLCGSMLRTEEWPREITKHFPATDKGRIFFSADGELNNVGIEYYPLYDKGIIADLFPLYRLSSSREIVPHKQTGDGQTAGLYGGSLYDVRYQQRLRMLDSLKAGSTRNLDRSVYNLPRIDDDYKYLRPLPEALAEVEAIDSILRFAGLKVEIQTGVFASEDSFKTLSTQENYLHVATHGFYIKASELDRHPYLVGIFGGNQESISNDPMLRTGLYLSGANQSLMGIKGSYEDGILTAKEISMLDLRGVELVVLSACETGLGDNGTDGVYGLQRAFKKAGVQSIVMTIHNVNDLSAAFLMKALYENRYLLGLSLHDAFYAAIRMLRDWESEHGQTQDWKSFILLDAYSPLE